MYVFDSLLWTIKKDESSPQAIEMCWIKKNITGLLDCNEDKRMGTRERGKGKRTPKGESYHILAYDEEMCKSEGIKSY